MIVSLQIDTYTKMNEENRRSNRTKEEKERFFQYYIDNNDSGDLSRLDYVKLGFFIIKILYWFVHSKKWEFDKFIYNNDKFLRFLD